MTYHHPCLRTFWILALGELLGCSETSASDSESTTAIGGAESVLSSTGGTTLVNPTGGRANATTRRAADDDEPNPGGSGGGQSRSSQVGGSANGSPATSARSIGGAPTTTNGAPANGTTIGGASTRKTTARNSSSQPTPSGGTSSNSPSSIGGVSATLIRGGSGGSTPSTTSGAASGGTNTNASSGGLPNTNSTNASACTPTFQSPPQNVAAWVNESWNSELGANIKGREAWLLDSVMKGKGQINLCVRWGASTAPSTIVKTGMAAAAQKWFNDWFSQLKDYACFPYSSISVKVTGWAVAAGKTSWVSDLGSDIKIYTETDADGEPKCPDDCSFFTNWSHSFPRCSGGEAFHHDYWMWLDDSIGGGAAAVGGDWGLRMPVSNFVASMGKSDYVIEHEMGHGFGFQDYYTWTGSEPAGGSLMIVGSTNNPSPTTADMWLLRRTWQEMKNLRKW